MRAASPFERGGADTSALLRQVLARLWRRSTEGGWDESEPPHRADLSNSEGWGDPVTSVQCIHR